MKTLLIAVVIALSALLVACSSSSAPHLMSIQVTPANPSIAAGLSQQFTATGTYSDSSTKDLTASATWSSSNTSVATIAPGGKATSTAQGSTTINASASGVNGTTQLQVTAPVLVSIAVAPANATIPVGTLDQFTATGTLTDGSNQDLTATATWSSTDNTVVSIAAGGLATARALGGVTITATSGGINGDTPLTVAAATPVSLTIPGGDVTIANGTSHPFFASAIYNDGSRHDVSSQVAWNSSQTAVATIGAAGKAQALSPGSTTITATLSPLTANVTLTVSNATIASISVSPSTRTIAPLTRLSYTAVGLFSDASIQDLSQDVVWASSDTGVATISNQSGSIGIATGVSGGATLISASFGGINGSVPLTVTSATITSITLTPASAGLAPNSTLGMNAVANFSDGTKQTINSVATWSSSDNTVATVNNVGSVTGLADGAVTITTALGGVSNTANLTVEDVTSVAITPASLTIAALTAGKFKATATLTDGSTQDLTPSVIWTSSMAAVAVMSNASGTRGNANGVAAGNSTITAVFAGQVATAQVTVTNTTLNSIAVTPVNPVIALGTSQAFKAVGTFSDTTTQTLTDQVTWTSSDTGVAIINASGVAASANTGSTTISASMNGVTGMTSLTVQ